MDYDLIRKLVKLVDNADIQSLEIEEGELQIRIEKGLPLAAQMMAQPPLVAAPVMPQALAPVAAAAPAAAPEAVEAAPEVPSNLIDVKAPMVGTFYSSPSPEAPSFIAVGDTVKPGKTLCILEAMKIMNEIEAEISGRIVEILIENGQPVQFDQVLFRVEPV
jgi:acetyl-CoA carboxylase biotin carboxyl carrier protein